MDDKVYLPSNERYGAGNLLFLFSSNFFVVLLANEGSNVAPQGRYQRRCWNRSKTATFLFPFAVPRGLHMLRGVIVLCILRVLALDILDSHWLQLSSYMCGLMLFIICFRRVQILCNSQWHWLLLFGLSHCVLSFICDVYPYLADYPAMSLVCWQVVYQPIFLAPWPAANFRWHLIISGLAFSPPHLLFLSPTYPHLSLSNRTKGPTF